MRTLIVFLHGIGDNIMFTGVVREYKKANPEEDIDLLVLNKDSAEVWKDNPHINKTIVSNLSYNPRFWNLLAFYFVDYQKIRKEIAELRRANEYDKVHIIKITLLPEIVYRLLGIYGNHKVERMASELGVSSKNLQYEIFPSKSDEKQAEKLISQLKLKNFAVIHPFSRDPLKNLSESELNIIMTLLKSKHIQTLVVGSLNDKPNFNIKYVKSCFGLGFGVLASLIKKARLFVGTDSAIAHLSGTAEIPIFIISNRGRVKFSHGGLPEWFLPYKKNAFYLTKDEIGRIESLIKN